MHKLKFIILAALLLASLAPLKAAYASSAKGGIRKLNYKGATIAFETKATINYSPKLEGNGWVSPGNTTYFINPVNGNDDHSGLTEDQAWRTFSHINQLQFSPGDNIKITAAGQFNQTLILRGKGTVNNPVKVHFASGKYNFFTDRLIANIFMLCNTRTKMPKSSPLIENEWNRGWSFNQSNLKTQ